MKKIEEYAAEKYQNELKFPEHKKTKASSYVDWALIGAREAQRWIPISEEQPPIGEEVIFKNEAWINEDFNPRGIRVGFKTDEDYITAHWWDYQDTYMTISHSDCDNNEAFSENIKNSIEPTHWRPFFRD